MNVSVGGYTHEHPCLQILLGGTESRKRTIDPSRSWSTTTLHSQADGTYPSDKRSIRTCFLFSLKAVSGVPDIFLQNFLPILRNTLEKKVTRMLECEAKYQVSH
jgi:hypothetical protein